MERRKMKGLDEMPVDRTLQEKYKENEVETLILLPRRKGGVDKLTEEEKQAYLQLTEKQLEKMQIKSTFIIVWKAMAHQIKQMENKEENIETKNDKIDGLNQKERDDGDEER